MKKFITIVALVCSVAIYANILEEYEKDFKFLTDKYEVTLSMDDSLRPFDVYMDKFVKLVQKSKQMQNKINFEKIKNIELEDFTKKMYEEFKRSRKIEEEGSWHKKNKNRITWNMNFYRNKIEEYLEELNDCGFPDKIDWEDKKAYRFKYFQELHKKAIKQSDKTLELLHKAVKEKNYRKRSKKIVEREVYKDCGENLVELVKIARILQNKIDAEKIEGIDLHNEILVIRRIFKDFVSIVEDEARDQEYAKAKAKKLKKKNAKKKEIKHIKLQELDYAKELLAEYIKQLKELNFEFINENLLKDKGKSISKNGIDTGDAQIDLSSRDEMLNKLREIRNELIASSAITMGADNDLTTSYLNTLTSPEKKKYNQILNKYSKRYDGKMAKFRAIKELHTILKRIKNKYYTVKDLEEVFNKQEEPKEEDGNTKIIFTGNKNSDIKLLNIIAKKSKEQGQAVWMAISKLEKSYGTEKTFDMIKFKEPEAVIGMAENLDTSSTYRKNKVIKRTNGLPNIKDALLLFETDGLSPRKKALALLDGNKLKEGVSSYEFEMSPNGPCENLSLKGKGNFVRYFPAPYPTASSIMKCKLTLNITDNSPSQNIDDIAKFIELGNKMSMFVIQKQLPRKIIDTIKILEKDSFSDTQQISKIDDFEIKFSWGELTITSLKEVNGFKCQ